VDKRKAAGIKLIRRVEHEWFEDGLALMPDIIEAGDIRLRLCPNFIHCPHNRCCYHTPNYGIGSIIDCHAIVKSTDRFPERIQLVEVKSEEEA